VGEEPLQEQLWKMSEDKPQVYSVKKTCGSEIEDCGRQHGVSVPLQIELEAAGSNIET